MGTSDVYTYIDETGDRGQKPTSSPIFGMAAVLVDDHAAAALRLPSSSFAGTFELPMMQ